MPAAESRGPTAIGIDIGATKVLGGVVNVGTGAVLHAEEIPALPRRDPVTVLDDVLGLAERMRDAAARDRVTVRGLGVGIAEIVDPNGRITTRDTFDWLDLPVHQRFGKVASPVVIESDVRAAACAEARYGAGRGLDTFAYVTIGSGISSCLMIKGRPLVGHTGSAIALTSATTREHCPSCGETHDFCLEAFASGLGMTRRYAEATSRDVRRTEEIFDAAASGDVKAVHVIESAARALGKALAQLANLFDPAAIVLGGGLGRTSDRVSGFRGCRLASLERQAIRELERRSVHSAIKWCRDQSAVLDEIEAAVAGVTSFAGSAVRVNEAVVILGKRAEYARLEAGVDELTGPLRSLLTELATMPQAEQLRAAAAWVRRVRRHFAEKSPNSRDDVALLPETAVAVMATPLTLSHIGQVFDRSEHSRQQLLDVFRQDYSDSIRERLTESFDAAFDLLGALESSVEEVDVWSHFVGSQHELVQLGLESVVELCKRRSAPAADIPKIVKHSVLRAWVDDVVGRDSRLGQGVALDRDRVRQEFRQLDRELVKLSAAAVINACAQRRPTSMAGGAGLIKREAQKSKRHWPVRRLLDEAGDAAQRLKPCFMMSPLSVSQFLPPDLRFDAVVFDEASQVTEADAVNCIYRGRQLIVAGDDNQLPPTNFFAKLVDDDADDDTDDELVDFESILGRCKAQGFRELPLTWHYRSRHEGLIAFSNRSFYEGKLQTFPGADFDAPDLGVEFFPVKGTYRRGATSDNREEAAAAVDRVLHHRRHHPELTIGVVALSSAQQDAVESELERRARSEPELWRLLESDDRLSGLFVKNLETVHHPHCGLRPR